MVTQLVMARILHVPSRQLGEGRMGTGVEAETSGEGMACAKAVGNRGATGGPAGGAGASVRKAGARRGQKEEGLHGHLKPSLAVQTYCRNAWNGK